ncbi:cation channel family protein, putative (macronuclear) [Tetrahymena thermophila SB210]|uniref:Cation channel family protein, putative n=1 Tax=Tetrahymena thermophila (strain SB210) TaxID=312017 RepID=Q24HT4_TETTS|nr:cation channel family protein, putative [Tetrahymena thermophila SB210]EAS07353.2 cation channel family protein, putative [Tetrahymena thermophila SB210]|eukprot:XP_001027595.2 cation channel family protein, putative [Tetrahymena thermophila SB210]
MPIQKSQIVFNLLKLFDIYGVPIRINFQRKETHKTIFGAIISIIVMMTFGLFCYIQGMELFQKANPIVITSEQYVKNPQRMDIDKTQQVIVMGFFDHKAQTVYDPSIIQVTATISNLQKVYNSTAQGYQTSLKNTQLKIRPCNQQDIKIDKLQGYFSQLTLNQYFCFDDNQEVYVEGDFSGDFYSKVDVYFSQCKNSTQPNSTICQPQEYINNVTSNLFFQAYMIDKIVDPLNLDNPFDYQGFNIETQTSIFQSQQFVAFFENYYVQSDIGLISKSVKEVRDFLYIESHSSNIYGIDGLLIQFTLRPYKNKQLIMQRRYMKFSDLFAQLGGILKVITLIGFVLAYPFAKIHLKKEITNSIFEFDFDIEQDEKTNKKNQMTNNFEKKTTENNQKMNQIKNDKQDCLKDQSKHQQSECDNDIVKLNNLSYQIEYSPNNRRGIINEQKQQFKNNQTQKQDQELENIHDSTNYKANISESQIINSFNVKNSQNFVFRKKQSQYLNQGNEIEDGKKAKKQLWKGDILQKEDHNLKQSFLDIFKKILNPHKMKINFSLIEYIQQILSCTSSKLLKLKKYFINEGIDKVQNHLDIQYILQKLQEVEKLKQVILNEDQVRLFELLPRPILHKKDHRNYTNKTNQFYDQIYESYEEKIINAYISLINILNQRKKSQRDHQLIQLLDEKIYQTIKNTGLLSNSMDNQNHSYPNYPFDNNSFQQDEINEFSSLRNSKADSNFRDIDENIKQKIELLFTKLDVPEENSSITNSHYFSQIRHSKQNSLNKR